MNPETQAKNELFSSIFGRHIHHFKCLMSGASGTGKTHLLVQILRNNNIDYDCLYIFSPSAEQSQYENLSGGLKNGLTNEEISCLYKDDDEEIESPTKLYPHQKVAIFDSTKPKDVKESTVPRFCFSYSDVSLIPDISSSYSYFNKSLKNIVVFDDILGIKNKHAKKIISFFTHGRHCNASLFILTQKMTAIDTVIRGQIQIYIIFKPFKKRERQDFYYSSDLEDIFPELKSFYNYIKQNLKKSYDFVVLTPQSNNIKAMNREEFMQYLPL